MPRACSRSELQRSQLTDLHGHATLAAALQRALCSEVKLEGIGLSCLVFEMDGPCVKAQWGVASQLNLKCCLCHLSTEFLKSVSVIKAQKIKKSRLCSLRWCSVGGSGNHSIIVPSADLTFVASWTCHLSYCMGCPATLAPPLEVLQVAGNVAERVQVSERQEPPATALQRQLSASTG